MRPTLPRPARPTGRARLGGPLAASVLLALVGPLTPLPLLTAPSGATSPVAGLCAVATALDLELANGFDDPGGDLYRVFAAEGVALVSGRPALLGIQLFDSDEEECAARVAEQTPEGAPFGGPSSGFFTPGLAALGDADAEVTVQADLRLTREGPDGRVPVDWDVLGGLEGAFGTTVAVHIAGPARSEAHVELSRDAAGAASVLLAFEPREDAADAYRIDVGLLVWSDGLDPAEDDATRTVSLELGLVVAPPPGMCLATLVLDADAYEAALAAVLGSVDDLRAELLELRDERDELEDELHGGGPPTPEQSARLDEIDARLDEIARELVALRGDAVRGAAFDAVVTELEPSTRLLLRATATVLLPSSCATFLGPDAVFVPSGSGPARLGGIDDLAVRVALERDAVSVDWDTVGGGFVYSELVDDLVESAGFDFPGRAVEPVLVVAGAILDTDLVPTWGTLDRTFGIEVAFVAGEQLASGTYTVRAAYLDVDDPADVRTVGTTARTLTVLGAAVDGTGEPDGTTTGSAEVGGMLSCSTPVVGVGVSCVLTATPSSTFTWEASTNPVFATGEVTTDAAGIGPFSFDVPASVLGQPIVVEVIGIAGSGTPIGVAAAPIPTRVPAGEGPALGSADALLVSLALLGAAGVWTLGRRRATGSAVADGPR